ncbi:winged helix-turn-helix domain-containing protein [Paramicrobacterium fandaimingii]|uniref:winged helix-turn-helix domain-containing protein n=1 Tax=Paramicrobacterium fandaimingii TaxID=2708079 RepID=UPI00141ECED1|nr:winged helix-turn-helix domain-containing protein [Microbacterium fandaimingii]
MKSSAAVLSPILRSDTQGRMLASLLLDPEVELTLTELARRANVAVPTILRDVDRLVAGEYLRDRRIGRSRLIRANTSHPLFAPLRQIIMYGYGPAVVLTTLLADVSYIDAAYIYGSWAERSSGKSGHDPEDIDVLVIGHADQSEVYALARKASQLIGKEVNINQIAPERWASADDGFITTVRSRPLVPLTAHDR